MPDNRILVFDNLSAFAAELKAKYARQTALEALSSRVDALVTAGGEPNKLDGVKVNEKPTAKGLYIHNGKKVIVNK